MCETWHLECVHMCDNESRYELNVTNCQWLVDIECVTSLRHWAHVWDVTQRMCIYIWQSWQWVMSRTQFHELSITHWQCVISLKHWVHVWDVPASTSHVTNSISRNVNDSLTLSSCVQRASFYSEVTHATSRIHLLDSLLRLWHKECVHIHDNVSFHELNVTNSFIEKPDTPLTQRMCTHIWPCVMSRTQCPKLVNAPNLQATHVYLIWKYTDTHSINGSIACV